MAKDKPSTYTPAPELPNDPELRRRFGEIVAVLGQTQTVSGAAKTLDLSRNHFQTILHRVIGAMIEELTPKPAGRPAKPAREAELEAENARLKEENDALRVRTEAVERMLTVVGSIASGRTRLPRSQPRSRGKKMKSEDPEPARIRKAAVIAMREHGAPTKLCVAALGVSPSTVRRAVKPKCTSKRAPHIDEQARQRVCHIVRATHGLAGARSLGRMCGLPRRICAEIKRRELTEMEHERKARCASVRVVAPGIVRGFDAMHVACSDGLAYLLVAADAAVPYRTSIAATATYDARSVIAALEKDFETHGPPLVVRLDRIACQRTLDVHELFRKYEVLSLHGPPRHPLFYGQLERQNREHRAWQTMLGVVTRAELAESVRSMKTALNTLWARPTLHWCTAEDAWQRRVVVNIDRRQLHADVERRTSGLATAGIDPLRAQRLAIESALTERGLLTINHGGWC
jgi:hypothetical protein